MVVAARAVETKRNTETVDKRRSILRVGDYISDCVIRSCAMKLTEDNSILKDEGRSIGPIIQEFWVGVQRDNASEPELQARNERATFV